MHRSRFYDIRASRTRLHDHFFGGRHYTTIALQPSVSAATTIAQRTFHVSALGPSAVPTPSVHTERPLPCCSMVSCSAPCRNSLHLLMLFEEAHDGSIRPHCQEHNDYACFDLDLTRGLVAFTFSLLPQCQVWSVHCRLGSNCESFFDACSVGIDSSCTGGAVRPAVTRVFSHWVSTPELPPLYQPQPAIHHVWLCCPRLHRAASGTTLPLTLTQSFMSTFTPSKIHSCPH